MPVMILDDGKAGSMPYTVADVLSYLAVVSRGMPSLMAKHRDLHPVELAVRLLRDVAILHGYSDDGCCHNEEGGDDGMDHQQTDVLVHRIRTNDPKLTKLALRNVRMLHQGRQVSTFREFTQDSIEEATEALHANVTIRSISCRYDWGYPRRMLHLLQYDEDYSEDTADGDGDGNYNLRAAATSSRNNHQVTKLQERRFFEACVCLPRLESISLTGGNRWRVSHLFTMLDTAKNLKHLTVRDVVVKSSSELNGLKRLLMAGCTTTASTSGRRNYAPIGLETIELAIEDQIHRNDEYWSAATAIEIDESPFDGLLEALVASPNIKEIKFSKSILSRFHLRPVHDVSTRTLLKLARCQSLSKLVLSGISVEPGGIEAMCEALIQRNGHLTHLEFYGCAFNHTVGQSGWNAMFRLIRHDPTIQIWASSLVYLQCRQSTATEINNNNNTNTNTNIELGQRGENNIPLNQDGEARESFQAFVRRPREDFSFSLRDKEGARKHFQNRGLDVRYKLQEAGFFRLLLANDEARSSDWIDVMARVGDDTIALFSILREIPSLCDVQAEREELSPTLSSTRHFRRAGRNNRKSNRQTKQRKVSLSSTYGTNRWNRSMGLTETSDLPHIRTHPWQCPCPKS